MLPDDRSALKVDDNDDRDQMSQQAVDKIVQVDTMSQNIVDTIVQVDTHPRRDSPKIIPEGQKIVDMAKIIIDTTKNIIDVGQNYYRQGILGLGLVDTMSQNIVDTILEVDTGYRLRSRRRSCGAYEYRLRFRRRSRGAVEYCIDNFSITFCKFLKSPPN